MKEEFERVYGPPGRRAFVEGLPCIASRGVRCRGPSNNHHIKNGGMGRKSDYTDIVPLCFDHHQEVHGRGQETFSKRHRIYWREWAETTESQWQHHTNREL